MDLVEIIGARFNYWVCVILMMIGLYAMIAKRNLIKKLLGMAIFQTAIILFYVSVGVKEGADLPIISHHGGHDEIHMESPSIGGDGHHGTEPDDDTSHDLHGPETATDDHSDDHGAALNPDDYTNPLPHVLMLTAIVVGVATLGVGLAITQVVFGQFQTLEEDEILKQIRSSDG